jgi:Protein of unknown function (DUF2846)
MKKNGLIGLLLAMVVLVTGCASVPMTSSEDDAKAKLFSAKPDKSTIYVYRNESFGSAIVMTVSLNGKVAGQTGPQTYFVWEVDPGSHEIASHTENVSTLKLTTEAGKTYYVWQEVKMGAFMARSLLQQVDEETGRKGVLECKRAQSAF